MRASVYRQFATPLALETVTDPTPTDHGVVIRVKVTGLGRSDWHGWIGHDPGTTLPHVPGHQLAEHRHPAISVDKIIALVAMDGFAGIGVTVIDQF